MVSDGVTRWDLKVEQSDSQCLEPGDVVEISMAKLPCPKNQLNLVANIIPDSDN